VTNVFSGAQSWVGPPRQITELSGDNDDTEPTFTGANLQEQAYCTDWGDVGLVHVFDEQIEPQTWYAVEAVGCSPGRSPANEFSTPLPVTTAAWGDLVGNEMVGEVWAPPQGVVDFMDISCVVDKFKNEVTAPKKARCDLVGDLVPSIPDAKIDFNDISSCVDAFTGHPYPFGAPAARR
jgi:hypothetical protein